MYHFHRYNVCAFIIKHYSHSIVGNDTRFFNPLNNKHEFCDTPRGINFDGVDPEVNVLYVLLNNDVIKDTKMNPNNLINSYINKIILSEESIINENNKQNKLLSTHYGQKKSKTENNEILYSQEFPLDNEFNMKSFSNICINIWEDNGVIIKKIKPECPVRFDVFVNEKLKNRYCRNIMAECKKFGNEIERLLIEYHIMPYLFEASAVELDYSSVYDFLEQFLKYYTEMRGWRYSEWNEQGLDKLITLFDYRLKQFFTYCFKIKSPQDIRYIEKEFQELAEISIRAPWFLQNVFDSIDKKLRGFVLPQVYKELIGFEEKAKLIECEDKKEEQSIHFSEESYQALFRGIQDFIKQHGILTYQHLSEALKARAKRIDMTNKRNAMNKFFFDFNQYAETIKT
jgi:hypothetical protein